MSKVLYRKYRSKSLDQIIGQDHITKILKNAIKNNRLSHAYLFTGPRGVGKTSIARILAHQINQTPYIDDQNNLDIIEIDAASNRRIDEIRELKDKVNILPSQSKYKIYIIDEVHMLTKEAFNALLKTLEEPPAHVIFILATTEYHKLPETIISRTQRFNFRPIPDQLIINHLRDIAKLENIKIDDGALEIIAKHGQGSFRDSISLLDQFSSIKNKIETKDVTYLLGIPSTDQIEKLIELLENPKSTFLDISSEIRKLYDQGQNSKLIANHLMEGLRQKLLSDNLKLNNQLAFNLLNDLIQVGSSTDPDNFLELILLKALPYDQDLDNQMKTEPKDNNIQSKPKRNKKPSTEPSPKSNPKYSKVDKDTWNELLLELKKEHNTLYGILRMAETKFDKNNIYLNFKFDFHQKRINDSKNKKIISDTLKTLTNQNYNIVTNIDKNLKLPEEIQKDSLDKVNSIFGQSQLVDLG